MQKYTCKKLLFISVFSLAILSFHSCSIVKPSQVKQAEKAERAKLKESEEAYQLLQDEHMERQSAYTKAQMENTKKRSEYNNRSKKNPSFWQRIFKRRNKR